MPRLRQLDALRGLAAVAVVLFHYTWWFQVNVAPHPPGLWTTFPNGHFGVYLFFIISGFVILMTLERSRGLAGFAISRVARLYPAFLACSAITGGVIVLGHFNPNRVTLGEAPASLTMLGPLLKWPTIDPSYWTLTFEVLFYVGASTLYLGLGWTRIEWPSLAWLAVSMMGHLAGLAGRLHRAGVLLDVSFANLFVCGMMLHRIASAGATHLTWVVLTAALAMTEFGPEWNSGHLPLVGYMGLIGGFCLAVFAAAQGWLRPLQWRPLLFLGDISYSLYLIHQLVGFWIIRRLELAGANPNLAIAAAVAVAIVLAATIRRLVERPVQQAIRAAYAARSPRGATAAA